MKTVSVLLSLALLLLMVSVSANTPGKAPPVTNQIEYCISAPQTIDQPAQAVVYRYYDVRAVWLTNDGTTVGIQATRYRCSWSFTTTSMNLPNPICSRSYTFLGYSIWL